MNVGHTNNIEAPCSLHASPRCRPLESYAEIFALASSPPAWRTLCRDLVPHSPRKIRNSELCTNFVEVRPENPLVFCHIEDDKDPPRRYHTATLPRTLLCHDMSNGYHDDSYVDGTQTWHAYTFYNWAGVDIFCYFSHHLVTIPPVGWINTAHMHGCKVIGTLITEWGDGIQFWKDALVTDAAIYELASALTAIAKELHFEGWLINVENKTDTPERLLYFVRTLHTCLHADLPDAVLIWYDAVTIEGKLSWQNKLNEHNRAFFDACDGIFTNYSWTLADLASTAVAAADRKHDVYIGMDVWGRHFYGGGMFNTQVAVEAAYKKGLSLAIFAPAWTHEVLEGTKDKYQEWDLRERAFWDSIWPFLNTTVPCKLPFKTTFCRGIGRTRRREGDVISPGPWYNLRHQQYQTNTTHGPHGYVLAKPQDNPTPDTAKPIKLRSKSLGNRTVQPDPNALPRSLENRTVDTPPTNRNEIPADRTSTSSGSSAIREQVSRKYSFLKTLCCRSRSRSDTNPVSSGNSMMHVPATIQVGRDRDKIAVTAVQGERECLEYCLEDAFTGGGCLRVHPSDAFHSQHRLTRLLLCDFTSSTGVLVVVAVTKTVLSHEDQYLTIQLQTPTNVVNLIGRAPDPRQYHHPIDTASPEFSAVRQYLILQQPDFYVSPDNEFGWTVRYFLVRPGNQPVTAFNLRTGLCRGPILLGHFGVCEVPTSVLIGATSHMRSM